MTGTTNTASKWWWLPGSLMVVGGLLFLIVAFARDKSSYMPIGMALLIIGTMLYAKASNAREPNLQPPERNVFQLAGERFHASVALFYLALGGFLGAGAAETAETRWWTMVGTAVFAACALGIWLLRGSQRRASSAPPSAVPQPPEGTS